MKIGAAFISDREDLYLPAALDSVRRFKPPGDPIPMAIVDDRAHMMGMAGAVRAAWAWAIEEDCDFLLHWEEDFVATGQIPLVEMATILDRDLTLAQVVLKRQPWSPAERAAGGIIELAPDAYEDRSFGPGTEHVVHGRVGDCGFSLNPCLVPRVVLDLGWPDGNEAEMSQTLVDKGFSFAFYGRRGDPPRCEHVGAVRGAGWRL